MTSEPPRVRVPAMRQRWRNVAFMSWPVPAESLRGHVPAGLELDLLDGRAWLTVTGFALDAEPPVGATALPVVDGAGQVNLRTYVVGGFDRRPGICLLSADVASRPLALAGRLLRVPYTWADVEIEPVGGQGWRYALRRRARDGVTAEFEVQVEEWLPDGARNVLDRFLTERWHAYSRFGPALLRTSVHHPQWPLRRASARRFSDGLAVAAGVPSPGIGTPSEVVAHWSEGVEAELGPPLPVAAGRAVS